jgi:excisionase family DNA binding protein
MNENAPRPDFLTTREVAALLRVRERKIYEMAAEGEIPCRKLTGKLLFPRAEIEAWLSGAPAPRPRAEAMPEVMCGSHDPLLDWAIRASGSGLATLFDGSLDGLDRLARGEAVAAGLHVFEPERGDWNLAHAEARLAGAPVVLVEWARRQQGVILAAGRAGRIARVADLAGLRIARRQPASGAGLLFDHLLAEAGLSGEDIRPLEELARTETEAATAVASGAADAAPGLEAAARQFGLAFLPTIEERFDLAVDRRGWFEPPMQRLLAFARGGALAEKAAALGGYDVSRLGTVRWNAP